MADKNGNPATPARARGAFELDHAAKLIGSSHSNSGYAAQRKRLPNRRDSNKVRAELIGSDTCTAAGMTVQGRAPALAMCRELIAAGRNADTALEVYRNGVLSLRIRSIGECAKLAVEECSDGVPRFRSYRPHPSAGSPPMRQSVGPDKEARA